MSGRIKTWNCKCDFTSTITVGPISNSLADLGATAFVDISDPLNKASLGVWLNRDQVLDMVFHLIKIWSETNPRYKDETP